MVLQDAHSNIIKKGSGSFAGFRYHLVFLYAYVLLVCKAMVTCYRINDFDFIFMSALFISGVLIYMLYLILPLKAMAKPIPILVITSVILLAAVIERHELFSFFELHIIQNFGIINDGIYTESPISFRHFLPFLTILVPATTALCIYFSSKGTAELSISLIALYMFSMWNNGLDRLLAKHVPYFILLSLLYFGISRHDRLLKKYRGSDVKVSISFKNILLYTVMTALAVTVTSAAAAHVFGTMSVVQLRSDYSVKEIRLESISKRSTFNLYNYGYGTKSSKLGGPVQLDSLIAMKVKASRPFYLRGAVKDHYDSSSWSKSLDDYTVKTVGTLLVPNDDFNLRMTGSKEQKPFMDKATIYPYGLATSTLFSPCNTTGISAKGGKILYDPYRSFILMGKDAVNESYTVKYYRSNTGIEIFDASKDKEVSFGYDAESPDPLKSNYYNTNVKEQYSTYLQVPESITPRTRKLVEDITKDCRTTEEKAAAIISYLSNNYPYSLDVSMVPEDTDFIDYFLFSEKKGYCTYFASAAALMCRIAGIPARYVEGFNMNDETDSSGLYIVRNHRAHAWVELLLSPESDLWCIADCVPQGAAVEDIDSSGQYRDRFDDDRYKSANGRLAKNEQSGYNNDSIPDYYSLLRVLLYPLFLIPFCLLLILSVYIVYRLILSYRLTNKLLKGKSVIPLYRHLAERLKCVGEAFPEESCELEYIRGMADKELSGQLEIIIQVCYQEFYGGNYNGTSINRKAFYKQFETFMRKQQGFFKYWYYRIRYIGEKER